MGFHAMVPKATSIIESRISSNLHQKIVVFGRRLVTTKERKHKYINTRYILIIFKTVVSLCTDFSYGVHGYAISLPNFEIVQPIIISTPKEM